MAAEHASDHTKRGNSMSQGVDLHVGNRVRERRLALGWSQAHVAGLIGVACQQAHKYERAINRMTAGRLYDMARALGVEVGYFFDGIDNVPSTEPTPQQRALLELAGLIANMPDRKHRAAICDLARVMAGHDGLSGRRPVPESDTTAASELLANPASTA